MRTLESINTRGKAALKRVPFKRDLLAQEIQNASRGDLRLDEPMGPHTTFGTGGPADLFFAPESLEDISKALPYIRDSGLPVLPLGGGTNTLVREAGFRGLVICLTEGATRIEIVGDRGFAQAGASLQVFSRRCQRAGRTGMEFGCGIPGSVGGAVRGNAGAWGGETLDKVSQLNGIDLSSGDVVTLQKNDVSFAYRHTDLSPDLLITEVYFDLAEEDPGVIQGRMDEMLSQRKATQPLWQRNAGCLFKNPTGTSAGLLIDQAGCKGLSVGAAQVSELHANFVVNLGGGLAEDVLSLADQVRARVREESGAELELEIRVVGEAGIENC